MRKIFMLLFSVTFAVSAVRAQTNPTTTDGPQIKWETTHHDFGKVNEADGPVTYRFKFKNTGTKNLLLTNVQPACGCTSSDWTKEEVKPGQEGYVSATYDVNNRPGSFSKSITVYTNAEPNIALITFSGDVVPKPKTIVDSFPYELGNLRLENNHINYGSLANNIKDTVASLYAVNTGKKPITISAIKSTQTYITSKELPITIKPNEKKRIPVHYNATIQNDYGMIFDQVKMTTDDDNLPEKSFTVIADLKQYFPKMTDAEKEKAPKIFIPVSSHDFGDVKQGEVVKTDFSFTNKGKKDLVIYKVKTTCGCTASDPEKKLLKPGETSNFHVSFNSEGKHGKEEKHITVYTNDPTNSEPVMKIFANVLTPEDTQKKEPDTKKQ